MAHHILIFGASGLIGEHITNGVIKDASKIGQISVFTSENTVKTKPEYINSLKSKGVSIIAGDLQSRQDVTKAYAGVDIVVSCVGRKIIEHQIDLVHWADEHPDVKHFFPSEYGTDIEYGPASAHEKPHQGKLKVRAALKELKNLDHTYVVTGPYSDGYLSALDPKLEAAGTFNVKEKRAVLLGDGNGKISLTTMRDVGRFVAASIVHLDKVKDRAIKVNSYTATPAEILKEFERQTKPQWQSSNTSLEKLKTFESDLWKAESPAAGVATLRRIWTEGGTLYPSRDNGLIGVEDTDTLETAVAEAIRVQTD